MEGEDLTTCFVCRHSDFGGPAGEPRNTVMPLPCGHSLCKMCYHKVVDRLNHIIKCGRCKTIHRDVTDTHEMPGPTQSSGISTSSITTATAAVSTVPATTNRNQQKASPTKQTKVKDFFKPVSRSTQDCQQASSSVSSSSDTPLYMMPPHLTNPKPCPVPYDIQSYITCATRELDGAMIELSVCCPGKDIKTWHINNNTDVHSSYAIPLSAALVNFHSWLTKCDIKKPLLIVGHTDFWYLLKSMVKENTFDYFKPYIAGFTDTRKNIFKDKGRKIESLRDIALDILGNQSTLHKENENDPKICATTLELIIEAQIVKKGRPAMLELLATHSRDFFNALEYSKYLSKIEENLNCQFENTCLATLIKRRKLRKDIGEKIAKVGFTYKDIYMLYRFLDKDMIHRVFRIDRQITNSSNRIDEVMKMLDNIGKES